MEKSCCAYLVQQLFIIPKQNSQHLFWILTVVCILDYSVSTVDIKTFI